MEKRKRNDREKRTPVRTEQSARKAGKQSATVTYVRLLVQPRNKIKQRVLQVTARKRRLSRRVIGSRVHEDVISRLFAAVEIRVDGIERSFDGVDCRGEVFLRLLHVSRRNGGVGEADGLGARGRRSWKENGQPKCELSKFAMARVQSGSHCIPGAEIVNSTGASAALAVASSAASGS